MAAFDQAWKVLKALEEQQGFTMSTSSPPRVYGQEGIQQRAGTIHPAILGMMERRQREPSEWEILSGKPFPDRRIVADPEGFTSSRPHDTMPSPHGTIVNQEVPYGDRRRMYADQMNPMTGELSDDETGFDTLTDAAQRERGSVFDAGHYNKHGLPMVGVRQPTGYRERRKPRYPNSNPKFQPYTRKNQYVQDILDLFRSGYYN